MGGIRDAVVGLVGLCFVATLVVRPVVAIPGLNGAVGGESGLVLWLPLLFVTLAIGVFRLRSSGDDTDDQLQRGVDGNHWADERPESDRVTTEQTTNPANEPSVRFLSGQGGARDRSFEIETEPPDAELGDHLDHLRAELDDETTELTTLESVVADEDEQRVPDYCPGEHCDALWEARTVTGITAGRYELLDDGTNVCCLECEETFVLES